MNRQEAIQALDRLCGNRGCDGDPETLREELLEIRKALTDEAPEDKAHTSQRETVEGVTGAGVRWANYLLNSKQRPQYEVDALRTIRDLFREVRSLHEREMLRLSQAILTSIPNEHPEED